MRSQGLLSIALLAVSALAAPTRQHPLVHEESNPYNKDYSDPYDKKVDSVGRKIQPLPMVSTYLNPSVRYVSNDIQAQW